jgi:hypothetical protein
MLDIADECDGCGIMTRDLTALGGWKELCPSCWRIAIAETELPREERPTNARDVEEGYWEP